MLPFLKPKKVAGLIISQRKPDGKVAPYHEAGDENHALDACSEDLMRAITSKDISGISSAIRAAYEILDSESAEDDSNDFESQNIKAAKERE